MAANERERERMRGRRRGSDASAGVKSGEPSDHAPCGGWGLLDLFEDQEEDVEEARETQTVVGRESDGSEPARAR